MGSPVEGIASDPSRLSAAALGLRGLGFVGTYSTGDSALRRFYLPALAASCSYDRMAGYYSSSVLRVAGRGMRRFLVNAQEHGGRMRLIVGAQMTDVDVHAVREGSLARSEALGRAARRSDLGLDGDPVGDGYLRLLGWMVREGLLDIKVGIPLDQDGHPQTPERARGYFHSKYGLLTDHHGDKVAFLGSENETASGWLYNHETFSVAPSWLEETWAWQGKPIALRFDQHWEGRPDAGWTVLPLRDVDDRLLTLIGPDFVPPDHDPIWQVLGLPDPDETRGPGTATITTWHDLSPEEIESAWAELVDISRTPADRRFTAALSAPAAPLPYQARLVHRAVDTYPRGYLFADPVGFGKTVEVGLTLRELLLSGKAKKALILVPASVLRQWQEELAEKIGLVVPRYDGIGFFDLDDEPVPLTASTNPWSAFPIVLASSHLARRRSRRSEVLAAGPWDVVVVDEAHHARRRGSKPTDTPNSLLLLLQSLHDSGAWKALYLSTATPMQMHPHEAWDLINLLDLPGMWGQSAADFLAYYEQLRLPPATRAWTRLSAMLADFFADPAAVRDEALAQKIRNELGAVKAWRIIHVDTAPPPPETAAALNSVETRLMDTWLRRHTPMKDRVFRNTRDTLRAYQAAGLIPPDLTIPERHVEDSFIALDDWERRLYERIEQYIRRYYNAYMASSENKALGFIMTVYRRRLTSSFYAIRQSLKRRLAALEAGLTLGDLITDDDTGTLEEDALFDLDDADTSLRLLQGEIEELRDFVRDLEAITGEDSKASRLAKDLAKALRIYSSVVVFTQYTDTMDYVRGRLIAAGYASVGCYSGRGGEIWDGQQWSQVSKESIKDKFRAGELHVLIGTDSMSEGLNLQTSSRLINYDMPWNLMRVEQRIGRIDRIRAARADILVSNYFYAGTVEEAVYKGIAEDYDDFTDIVGSAQPVLANIEQTIERLALAADSGADDQAAQVRDAVARLRDDIAAVNSQPVLLNDLGNAPESDLNTQTNVALEALQLPDEITDSRVTERLGERLLANALTRQLFKETQEQKGVYEYTPPRKPNKLSLTASHPTTPDDLRPGDKSLRLLVTFDRNLAEIKTDVVYISYGSPLIDGILP